MSHIRRLRDRGARRPIAAVVAVTACALAAQAQTWRRIAEDIIHWDKRAPGGQPTRFVYSGKETCFFPGDGGL